MKHLEVVDFIPHFPNIYVHPYPSSVKGVGEVIDYTGDSSLTSNLTVAQK